MQDWQLCSKFVGLLCRGNELRETRNLCPPIVIRQACKLTSMFDVAYKMHALACYFVDSSKAHSKLISWVLHSSTGIPRYIAIKTPAMLLAFLTLLIGRTVMIRGAIWARLWCRSCSRLFSLQEILLVRRLTRKAFWQERLAKDALIWKTVYSHVR